MTRFNQDNFYRLCSHVAQTDPDLSGILKTYGPPPLWTRPNSFSTLVLIILEQQVSLAAAYAAYKKLREKLKRITPEAIAALSDEELRACYFSRQKIVYVRGLAAAFMEGTINLRKFYYQPDDTVRAELKKLKGIGDWTVDIYLLHALKRTDIFPIGDLALVNALKEIKQLPSDAPKETLREVARPWQPYRSIATMILWHYYIQKRNIKLLL